jgi:hypothetical protein
MMNMSLTVSYDLGHRPLARSMNNNMTGFFMIPKGQYTTQGGVRKK